MYNWVAKPFKINGLAKQAISTFFAILFLLALGATVDTQEARGQVPSPCPSGYEERIFGIWIDNCFYYVRYCNLCDPEEGNHSVMIKSIYTHHQENCDLPVSPIALGLFWEAIYAEIRDQVALYCDFIPCHVIPYKRIERITTPLCWQIKNTPANLMEPRKTEFISCEGGPFCVIEQEVCYDYIIIDPGNPTRTVLSETKTLVALIFSISDIPSGLSNICVFS